VFLHYSIAGLDTFDKSFDRFNKSFDAFDELHSIKLLIGLMQIAWFVRA